MANVKSNQVITPGHTKVNIMGQSAELKDDVLEACTTAFDLLKQQFL